MIEFSIVDAADQQFGALLNNRRVTLRLRYNTSIKRWGMDVSIDDLPVLQGRKIVTGVDLLEPFDFDIGAIFAVPVKEGAVPDRQALVNGDVRLYHASAEEIASAL